MQREEKLAQKKNNRNNRRAARRSVQSKGEKRTKQFIILFSLKK